MLILEINEIYCIIGIWQEVIVFLYPNSDNLI